jgi:hypothetical protein
MMSPAHPVHVAGIKQQEGDIIFAEKNIAVV